MLLALCNCHIWPFFFVTSHGHAGHGWLSICDGRYDNAPGHHDFAPEYIGKQTCFWGQRISCSQDVFWYKEADAGISCSYCGGGKALIFYPICICISWLTMAWSVPLGICSYFLSESYGSYSRNVYVFMHTHSCVITDYSLVWQIFLHLYLYLFPLGICNIIELHSVTLMKTLYFMVLTECYTIYVAKYLFYLNYCPSGSVS